MSFACLHMFVPFYPFYRCFLSTPCLNRSPVDKAPKTLKLIEFLVFLFPMSCLMLCDW